MTKGTTGTIRVKAAANDSELLDKADPDASLRYSFMLGAFSVWLIATALIIASRYAALTSGESPSNSQAGLTYHCSEVVC